MKIKRLLISILGFFCLGIGAVGIFLPFLPTTPFVLLATVCFSSSNRRFYERLKDLPFFGPYIMNFEEKQGIPISLKIKSILFVWVSLVLSMFALQTTWVYILLCVIGIGVTAHLLMIKTKEKSGQDANYAILKKNSSQLFSLCPLCAHYGGNLWSDYLFWRFCTRHRGLCFTNLYMESCVNHACAVHR